MSTPTAGTPFGPLWLSHHHPGEADRCIRIAGRHVCRRCAAVFAGFVPAAALLASGRFEAQTGDVALVAAMTAFAAYEFVQVVRGAMAYSPRRVLVVSPFAGVVLAWLGVTGFRDGLGVAHVSLGLLALALVGVLFANGSVERRPAGVDEGSGAAHR